MIFTAIYWPYVKVYGTVEAITNLLLYWSNFDRGMKILCVGKTAERILQAEIDEIEIFPMDNFNLKSKLQYNHDQL